MIRAGLMLRAVFPQGSLLRYLSFFAAGDTVAGATI